MRRSFPLFSAVLAAALLLGLQTGEAKGPQAPEEVSAAQYNTVTATVISVNQANHTLMLENDEGIRHEVKVDPTVVKNFKNIKKGDLVVIRETEQIALTLTKREKGQEPEAGAALATDLAPEGQKPGMAAVETAQISAEIVKVDQSNQTVDLKGPEGNVMRLKARDPNNLAKLKKGDMVTATYTKAFAISVEPAPAK
jgi:ribosomal protein S17